MKFTHSEYASYLDYLKGFAEQHLKVRMLYIIDIVDTDYLLGRREKKGTGSDNIWTLKKFLAKE